MLERYGIFPAEVKRDFSREVILETGQTAMLQRLAFEDFGGQVPVLTTGRLENASSIAMLLPGSVPTMELEHKAATYYSLVAEQLADAGVTSVLLANWSGWPRDYGPYINSFSAFSCKPQSVGEKIDLISCLRQWIRKQTDPDTPLLMVGHSSGGGALLRVSDKLLRGDSCLKIIADAPTAIGADSRITRTFGKLAKAGGVGAAIRLTRNLPESWQERMMTQYGLTVSQARADQWIGLNAQFSPHQVANREVQEEHEYLRTMGPVRFLSREVRILIGENDPLVAKSKLKEIAGVEPEVLKNGNHFTARTDPDQYARVLLRS
ncbi:MAG: alpha/beta hydrolase [Candidatus Shapirobacteria bacterium]